MRTESAIERRSAGFRPSCGSCLSTWIWPRRRRRVQHEWPRALSNLASVKVAWNRQVLGALLASGALSGTSGGAMRRPRATQVAGGHRRAAAPGQVAVHDDGGWAQELFWRGFSSLAPPAGVIDGMWWMAGCDVGDRGGRGQSEASSDVRMNCSVQLSCRTAERPKTPPCDCWPLHQAKRL